jgi:DNA-binding transcriptional MerR regulator
MQIKQVSRQTGLSERTIRYYEQEGLVVPAQTDRNGRAFRAYSPEDVATLTHISRLRRAEFSISEIREILADANRIPGIVEPVRNRLGRETEAKRRILEVLDSLDEAQVADLPALSGSLELTTERVALPAADMNPNFGRFDGITKEEREKEFQAYLARNEKTYRRGRAVVLALILMNLLIATAVFLIRFQVTSAINIAILAVASYALLRSGSRTARSLYSLCCIVYFAIILIPDSILIEHGWPSLLSSFFRIILWTGLLSGFVSSCLLSGMQSVDEYLPTSGKWKRKAASRIEGNRTMSWIPGPVPTAYGETPQEGLRCPVCDSERVRIEPVRDGIGAFALGVASTGHFDSSIPNVGGAPSQSPIPPVAADEGDVHAGGSRVSCEACGHVFHVQDRAALRRKLKKDSSDRARVPLGRVSVPQWALVLLVSIALALGAGGWIQTSRYQRIRGYVEEQVVPEVQRMIQGFETASRELRALKVYQRGSAADTTATDLEAVFSELWVDGRAVDDQFLALTRDVGAGEPYMTDLVAAMSLFASAYKARIANDTVRDADIAAIDDLLAVVLQYQTVFAKSSYEDPDWKEIVSSAHTVTREIAVAHPEYFTHGFVPLD